MQPSLTPSWDQVDTFGGIEDKEYQKLPELYRQEVAELRAWAERRDAVHRGGGSVPMEEMDKSGARENELHLPPLVLSRMRRIMDQVQASLAMMMLDDPSLVDEAQQILHSRDIGPDLHRFSAEQFALKSIDGASNVLAVGMEETVLNALKHGIHGDMRRRAVVRRRARPEIFVAQVEDEGLGYVRSELPDPLTALESGHGRGLLLTDEFADSVERNDRGTLVTITITRGFMRDRVLESLRGHLSSNIDPDKIMERLKEFRTKYYVEQPLQPSEPEQAQALPREGEEGA